LLAKEEGSSATSNVRDVTDVTDGSPMEEGQRRRKEGSSWALLRVKRGQKTAIFLSIRDFG
jgi:hypothetical protein